MLSGGERLNKMKTLEVIDFFFFFFNQSSNNLVERWDRYFRKGKGGKEVETVCLDNEQVKSLSCV